MKINRNIFGKIIEWNSKAKKPKVSLYDFCKNGYKMPDEDLKQKE